MVNIHSILLETNVFIILYLTLCLENVTIHFIHTQIKLLKKKIEYRQHFYIFEYKCVI